MILIIDDDIAVRASLSLLLKEEGYKSIAVESPESAITHIQKQKFDLILLDMNFSNDTSGDDGINLLIKIKKTHHDIPIILITGWATIELAVRGMKLGANDFINKPWQNDNLMQSIKTLLSISPGLTEVKKSKNRKNIDAENDFSQIIGEDDQILRILDTISLIAKTNASVLITGESGTGKELIAEAIHQNSLRSHRPFVKVNLGGISTSLFESEMFGHIRGAFTDAKYDRVGRFEMANKGTIFLDEIGDLELNSQVKLLRVLQDRTYEVLGSSRTKNIDVRIVCATNRNLGDMVLTGSFREDLLYRINLITIHLPALRDRVSDIPLLVNFFIKNLREIYDRPNLDISKDALKWLKQLPLPGNIRQLKNLVERTVLVSHGDVLESIDFQNSDLSIHQKASHAATIPIVGTMTLEEMEISMIKRAMEFHKGKVTRVAQSLGLTRSSLYRRLEKYEIPFSELE
ncbi:MAG: sigma-54 dependent transcriptional regulator [Saprospiraceae bacterium]